MKNSNLKSLPVLIIGAGISGLILAQQLRKSGVPFQVFERDTDFSTRGVGWGLTLHWSLPSLRDLLPGDLIERLPETYVDYAAARRGVNSLFPFYDLSTGELKGASPAAPESHRIRVSREKLRRLLSEGIDIQWGKCFLEMKEERDHIEVSFEDGSTYSGLIVVGCDGSHSRVRRMVYPEDFADTPIPVRLLGFTLKVKAEQSKDLYKIDPFFFQGTSSKNNVFMYISLLHAPQNENFKQENIYQICISFRKDTLLVNGVSHSSRSLAPEERVPMIKMLSETWAEPFRSLASLISNETEVKQLDLYDFPPRNRTKFTRSAIVMGDAAHAMTMYRGEGANHAIVDVLDFKEKVLPAMEQNTSRDLLAHALQEFESGVIKRTGPAVQASRQACLDAHDWASLSPTSPLLTRRQMWLAQ